MENNENTNQHRPFGYHLMVDAYNCDEKALSDLNTLYSFLDSLPGMLDMKAMIKPILAFTPGNDHHDPGGWSGFTIIQESHISVHTFIKRRFVTIDAYSCKTFDMEKAINYIKEIFKTDDLEVYKETRGKKYPEKNIL